MEKSTDYSFVRPLPGCTACGTYGVLRVPMIAARRREYRHQAPALCGTSSTVVSVVRPRTPSFS